MNHPTLPYPAGKLDTRRGKLVCCAILVVVALLSATVLRGFFSSATTYSGIYETLDERQNNVLSLALGSALISGVISALPDDMGTSISSEFADFYTGFAVIAGVILLEKYLLTIIGFGFTAIIIPICCVLMISVILSPPYSSGGHKRRQMAKKLFVFGLTLFLMTPLSVFVSRQIDDTYKESIEDTIKGSEETMAVFNQEADKSEEKKEESTGDTNPFGAIQQQINNAAAAVGGAIDAAGSFASGILPWATDQMRTYAELFAVMLVTSIVIPLLVPVVAYLMFKILFLSDADVTIPASLVEALSSVKPSSSEVPGLASRRPEGTEGVALPDGSQAGLPVESPVGERGTATAGQGPDDVDRGVRP